MKYKFLIILLGSILLIGCNSEEHNKQYHAKRVTSKYYNYKKLCLQGVSYWRGYYTLTPVYQQNGSLELCEEK